MTGASVEATLEFESAKNEFGLDHNELRSGHGWYHHVSLVMLAFAVRHDGRLPAGDIVHLAVDGVELMDHSAFEPSTGWEALARRRSTRRSCWRC